MSEFAGVSDLLVGAEWGRALLLQKWGVVARGENCNGRVQGRPQVVGFLFKGVGGDEQKLREGSAKGSRTGKREVVI